MSIQTFRNRSSASRLTIALLLTTHGFAQLIPPTPGDPIMGFETTKSWLVKSSSPLTTVSAATVRTQGNLGLALGNPSSPTTLSSLPVASTSPALAGLGDPGAVFEVDLAPPSGSTGTLKLSVTSPSHGLRSEVVGEVDLKGLRPAIYNTIKFPIPDAVRRALADNTFKDLSFEFGLNSTGAQFLFDNLRVSSVPLLTAKAGLKVPANFGGTVDLVAIGDAPVRQSFNIGAIQVPEIFRLVQGAAAGTTVKLSLGHDSAAAFQCTYAPDPSDKNNQSYRLTLCTGGTKAGDLVGANSAELVITGGTSLMKLDAQLAKNPIGDLVGSDVIPPMPTFWGRSDTCVPAPVTGTVVTMSDSCKNQLAEANQIVTDYFNQVNQSNAAPNWIVAPPAARAIRVGTALDSSLITVGSSDSNNVPFSKEGHANKGGDFDAYWRLTGDLNTKIDQTTGNSSAHFDADFSGHVVLFGGDVDVVRVDATVDTTSGSAPSAKGSAHVYLFGEELPGGGTVNATTGFNYSISQNKDFNVFTIDLWIFSIQVGATANASLTASGTLAATGFAISVDPKASMGMHIFGGVNILIASGGVDARINLLMVSVPVTAQAGVAVNNLPTNCAINITFTLTADVTVSSLGGEIDLIANFGPCPFCDTESYTVVKWDPILSTTQNLVKVGPTTLAAIPLPVSLCSAPLHPSISSPGANVEVGLSYPLVASGAGTAPCGNLAWTVSPAEPITSSNGCQTSIQFNTPGVHTLNLKVIANFVDQFGRTITESGAAAKTYTVTTLPAGAYIISTNPAPAGKQAPFNNQNLSFTLGAFPARIQMTGELVGRVGTFNFTWTATDSTGLVATIPSSALPNSQSVASWSVPKKGVYTIKMTVTDSTGKTVGEAAMTVGVTSIIF